LLQLFKNKKEKRKILKHTDVNLTLNLKKFKKDFITKFLQDPSPTLHTSPSLPLMYPTKETAAKRAKGQLLGDFQLVPLQLPQICLFIWVERGKMLLLPSLRLQNGNFA
jgi:hypothetical protein